MLNFYTIAPAVVVALPCGNLPLPPSEAHTTPALLRAAVAHYYDAGFPRKKHLRRHERGPE